MKMCTGVQIEHKQHRKTLFGVADSELGMSAINQFSVCKKLGIYLCLQVMMTGARGGMCVSLCQSKKVERSDQI